jgi:hypothetical protein
MESVLLSILCGIAIAGYCDLRRLVIRLHSRVSTMEHAHLVRNPQDVALFKG